MFTRLGAAAGALAVAAASAAIVAAGLVGIGAAVQAFREATRGE